MAELKATIAIEKVVIHDALRESIQKISDEYGVMITDVDVGWRDFSSDHKAQIVGFEVRTRS